MRHNLLSTVLLFSITIIWACKGSKATDENTTYSDSLNGAWELRTVIGGFRAPGPDPVYAAGNGNIWAFTDSTYKQYDKGNLVDSGVFSIVRDTCPATNTLMEAFVPGNDHIKMFYEISMDTLTMYVGIIAADGYIAKYVRIDDGPRTTDH